MEDVTARVGVFSVCEATLRVRTFLGTWASRAACVTSLLVALVAAGQDQSEVAARVQLTRLLELQPDEGVFSYSRISPDGNLLAYASERRHPVDRRRRTIHATIADLSDRRIVFSEPGLDPYFSNDGSRVIYLYTGSSGYSTTIYSLATGDITRDVAPQGLGDYYSWGVRDSRDLILTIAGNYYFLLGKRAMMPHSSVPPCPTIGQGERPLLSKDGRRVTAFFRGQLLVRSLDNCADVIVTGIRGAKADFSFDGRYIAFHSLKPSKEGFQIQVIDLERRTIRTPLSLPGSSYFPSWTADGRLAFRYDGPDYRGFMLASGVLSSQEHPLTQSHLPPQQSALGWEHIFPESARPSEDTVIVTVWSTWSAHSELALVAANEASRKLVQAGQSVRALAAVDPGTSQADARRFLARHSIAADLLPLSPGRFELADADNQIPAVLFFYRGTLVDRRLGAQTADELIKWVRRRHHVAVSE